MPDLGTILVGIGVVLLVVVVLGAGLARRARRREAADKLRYRSQRRYVLYDGSPRRLQLGAGDSGSGFRGDGDPCSRSEPSRPASEPNPRHPVQLLPSGPLRRRRRTVQLPPRPPSPAPPSQPPTPP